MLWGFDNKLSEKIDWMFNLNHILLVLACIAMILILLFTLPKKKEKNIKMTKLILAGVLFFFEVGRIIYNLANHIHNGGTVQDFNWWWNISFQMCAIMAWTTIVTLILSSFLEKDHKVLQLLYNILFGAAMIGGILTYVYPDFIKGDRHILHFINVQTIVVHMLLIFVPLYFIKTKDFIVRISNIWKPLIGYIFITSVAMSASQISGQNFAFALRCPLFADIGLEIPFPWHLPILLCILYILVTIAYLIGWLRQRRIDKAEKVEPIRNNRYYYDVLVNIVSIVIGVLLVCLIPLTFSVTPINDWRGIICITPIFITGLIKILGNMIANKNETLKMSKV